VPIAKPQQIADRINNLKGNPLSSHLMIRRREAVEKNKRPRSTYTVIESFIMTGSERKKSIPKSA
jgi:hypothetical protein